MELREKVAQLPTQPGVYLFQDAGGTILYVGKANSLRSRVRSYFLESHWQDAKTGSWAADSMNHEHEDPMTSRFMQDAATAFAVLALVEPDGVKAR